MPDHAVIDRLVRGRAWIPVLGVMLAGIVAMQVEVLKLDAGIGRSMQQSSQLSTRNELLQSSVATLADDQRIESLAAKMGMIMPAPTAVGFLSAGAANVPPAMAGVRAPDAAQFLGADSSNGGVAGSQTLTSGASSSTSAQGGSTVGTTDAVAPTAATDSAGSVTPAASVPASSSPAASATASSPPTSSTSSMGAPATSTLGPSAPASSTGTAITGG